MDHLPKISIIIPCFNVPEEQIKTVLGSIKQQDFDDYEVIIVDDGSDESHHQLLVNACAEDSRAFLITQHNRGVSTARNTGVENAHGEYITFADADDALVCGFFEQAYGIAKETDADYIVGGVRQVNKMPPIGVHKTRANPRATLLKKNDFDVLRTHIIGPDYIFRFTDGYINRGPVARLIRRTTALSTFFDPRLAIGEDFVWNLDVLNHCNKACVVSEVWYLYLTNPNSAMHSTNHNIESNMSLSLAEICKRIDLDKQQLYMSYESRICECIHLIWQLSLNELCKEKPSEYRKVTQRIYTNRPWRDICEMRFFAHTTLKRRVFIIAYRLHMLFFMLKIGKGIKEIWKSN